MKRTLAYLAFSEQERPIALQLFGSNAESMAEAAQFLEEVHIPDVIDINLGCPVRKVTRTGAGAALLADTLRLSRVVSGVVEAVSVPVSAKIRLGWTTDRSVEIARMLSDCGVRFITVHARMASDGFGARADWDAFARIRQAISIPIIANGDIGRPEDAAYLLRKVGVSAVMIGRGAIGRPWIFSHMREYFTKGVVPPPPGPDKQVISLLKHLDLLERELGRERALRRIKKHIPYYLKSIPGGKHHAHALLSLKSFDEMRCMMLETAAHFMEEKNAYP